ncbi:hypothetical protein PAPYR_5528 [Paratrimastix pyriformis]|uniref:Uncharacterized protein n=1 Tax=Paratrimastix pyriformis TaxID=342808 RepID=A0ABQ8UPX9_9EUKA|nr:hypothetical protein PAPYR_5528 [Paratrimastix pyriformis]
MSRGSPMKELSSPPTASSSPASSSANITDILMMEEDPFIQVWSCIFLLSDKRARLQTASAHKYLSEILFQCPNEPFEFFIPQLWSVWVE